MPFDHENLKEVQSSADGAMWYHSAPDDTLAEVGTARYFRAAAGKIGNNSLIMVSASDGATIGYFNRATETWIPGGGAPSYTLPTPIVVHDFASATGWFPTNTGPITITAEASPQALVFTDTSSGSSGTATNHNVITGDPATWGVVALWSDLGGPAAGGGAGRDPALMLSGATGLRIGSGGANGIGGTFNSGAVIGDNIASLVENIGEYWSSGNVASMTGLPASGAIGLRTEPSVAPGSRSIRQKLLLANAAGRPTVLIRVDDALSSVKPTLLDMLDFYGFKATWFVPWADIGNVGGRLLLADVQAIRDAGHSVCLNLTEDDEVVTGLADPAAAVTKLGEGRTWLTSGGFAAEGGNHVVYSNGIFGVNPNPVQMTGVSGSSGSPVLTVDSSTGVTVGMRVVGVSIPNSPVTRVLTVDSATQITLTANLTAAISAGRAKALDDSSPFYSRLLQNALGSAGVKTGWTTLGGGGSMPNSFYSRYGVGNRGLVLPGNSTTNLAAGTIEGYIDDAIERGATVQFYVHGVVGTFNKSDGTDSGDASAGLTCGVGPLNAAFAYLKAKVNANLVSVMTVPDWWARDCATPAVPPGSGGGGGGGAAVEWRDGQAAIWRSGEDMEWRA